MFNKYDKIQAHRNVLKNQLFNFDYSNVPVSKIILVELDYGHLTCQEEGPKGFTHCKSSYCSDERLVDAMNKYVVAHPDYDLVIVDKYEETL